MSYIAIDIKRFTKELERIVSKYENNENADFIVCLHDIYQSFNLCFESKNEKNEAINYLSKEFSSQKDYSCSIEVLNDFISQNRYIYFTREIRNTANEVQAASFTFRLFQTLEDAIKEAYKNYCYKNSMFFNVYLEPTSSEIQEYTKCSKSGVRLFLKGSEEICTKKIKNPAKSFYRVLVENKELILLLYFCVIAFLFFSGMLKGHMFLAALSSLTALTIYTAISVADILFPSTSKIEIANKDTNIGADGVSKSSDKTTSYMDMFDGQDFASLDIFIDEDLPIEPQGQVSNSFS
jgi:hypothetical protein